MKESEEKIDEGLPAGFVKRGIVIDPMLLSVLSNRFEAIMREMTNTVIKASRSAIIKNGRDFSVGILTFDNRLISVEEGLPIHISALELTTTNIVKLFDDITDGDAFFNNSPYLGATHHADLDVVAPVYCDGEPMFWSVVRCHHADIGAPLPTTYLPFAKTIYEEGLHFPCTRIQRDRRDIQDVLRIARMKIRASDLWYGDYRAQVGACRIGERRLKELVAKYGKDTILAFIEEWMEYGKRRAIAAIRELPAGTYTYETRHDPIPGIADAGIPVKVKVTVDRLEGLITVDARDNVDCVDGGFNLTESTATGACRIGVYVNLDPSIPHNHGSTNRIRSPAPRRVRRRPAAIPGWHLGRHHEHERPADYRRPVLLHADGASLWRSRRRCRDGSRIGRHFRQGSASRQPRLRQSDLHRLLRRTGAARL